MPYYHRAHRYRLGALWIVGRVIGVLFIIAILAIIASYSALVGNGPSPAAISTPPAVASTSKGQ